MTVGWEWDETLFAGAAGYYLRGRLPYAPGWVEALGGVLGLDGRGRLLDVGCGPGLLALELAPRFREVVGVDPDSGMLAEAERRADAAGVAGRVRWVRARAEELPPGLGEFDAATFGRSFHWMDRDLVAATIREVLVPGGSFVQVSEVSAEGRGAADVEGLPYPAVPEEAVKGLVRRYLGTLRRAGRGTLRHESPSDEEAVLARAGFGAPRRVEVPGGQPLERTVDDVVALVFSKSSSTPHLFGADRERFEAELRGLLHEVSPAGRFSVRQPSTVLRVWGKDGGASHVG